MNIQENISLKPFHTFSTDVKAKYFAPFKDIDELTELLNANILPQTSKLILGGGSNILFTKDFDGLVLKNEVRGIKELHEDNDYLYIRAGGGENWHLFVMHCIDRGWAGVENMALIPGTVGAAPIQNIGAYGVELTNVFQSLEAYDTREKCIVTLTSSDCEFGYRSSSFKTKYKNRYIIISVTFRLKKKPVYHTHYGAVAEQLENNKVQELSIRAIAEAVIQIRSAKLPDPAKIGNAGSFFKNPVISIDIYEKLAKEFPGFNARPLPEGRMKVSAGWLIEQCGWKGYRKGDAGCFEKQALVLVNYGKAGGDEIFELSQQIAVSVKQKFGITLDREVNMF